MVCSHLSFSYCNHSVVNSFKIFLKEDLNFKSQEMNFLKNFIFGPYKCSSSQITKKPVPYELPKTRK